MCNCVNIAMGSYQNQTCINPPFPVGRSVISGPTGIDNCILEEVLGLWESGIVTLESCCGHNVAPGYIIVEDSFIADMLALGYAQNEHLPCMFSAKSVHLDKDNHQDKMSGKIKAVHDDLSGISLEIEKYLSKKPSRFERFLLYLRRLSCLVLTMVLLSCHDEEKLVYHVDPELQYYADAFYNEAAKRGITVPRQNLILTVEKGLRHLEASQEGVSYRALSSTHNGQVKIRVDAQYVLEADTMCVERTVFHEFGHQYFCRGHTTEHNIMNVSTPSLKCYSYDSTVRKAMIDELFSHSMCVFR